MEHGAFATRRIRCLNNKSAVAPHGNIVDCPFLHPPQSPIFLTGPSPSAGQALWQSG